MDEPSSNFSLMDSGNGQKDLMPKEPTTTTWSTGVKIAVAVVVVGVVGGLVALTVVLVLNSSVTCEEFKCPSGPLASGGSDCILLSSQCDGVQDCKNGEDEDNCPPDCSTDQFLCKHGGPNGDCIPNSYTCDGSEDCNNGTDELNCSEPPACQRTESLQQISTNCEADVGNCSVSFCSNDVNPKCCGPVYERSTKVCPEGDIEYSRVLKCECQICESPKVFIAGKIVGCEPTTNNCSFAIEIEGLEIARADGSGKFSFRVEFPSDYRITFSIIDDINEAFFIQTKSTNLIRDKYAYLVTVNVISKLKATTARFSTNETTTVELGTRKDVAVEFLPDSIYFPDGTRYEGEVRADVNLIDPQSRVDVEDIPGELITRNEDSDDDDNGGSPGLLSSMGMLQVDLRTDDGTSLQSNGTLIELKVDSLTEEEIEGMAIWVYNSTSGFWEWISNTISGELESRRRKRSDSSSSSVITKFDITNARRIWNLDYLLPRYCFMKVRLFKDAHQLESSQVHNIPVISLYARSSNGAWANFLRAYSWNQNGYCVSVPCDARSFDFVQVYTDDSDFVVVEPQVPESIQTQLAFDNRLNYFTVQMTSFDVVDNTNGPIYSKGWDCYSATFNKNHFRLSRSLPEDIEINTININEDNIFSPWISDPFSWWPNRNLFKACYVKVNVLTTHVTEQELKGWTVEAISRGGNHSVTKGKEYGRRITSGNNLTACVEYKCPDTLADSEFDRTEVTIKPILDGMDFSLSTPLNINHINSSYPELVEEYIAIQNQLGQQSLTAIVPLTPYPDLGIHTSEGIHPKLAKSEARRECIQGPVSILTFSASHAELSGSGSGSGSGSDSGSGL